MSFREMAHRVTLYTFVLIFRKNNPELNIPKSGPHVIPLRAIRNGYNVPKYCTTKINVVQTTPIATTNNFRVRLA